MEAKPKAKRAPRKKAAPAAESVVSAFGGAVVAPVFVEVIEHVETPSPVRKGRKPAVVAQVTPEGVQGSLTPMAEQRPLITHLPIRASDIDNEMFAPTPTVEQTVQPTPFDLEEAYASFSQEQLETKKAEPASRPALPLHYSERLMVRFQDANRTQRLPESTDVACFWDCQPFTGTPCVIPSVIEEGIWRVYGNFCCPECAAAYLFNERLDLHVQWERYSLLNRLYSNSSESVRLAPARTILRLFGGAMDISDFRAIVADKRLRVDVMMPPMISIIQVMDTKPIDFYDASMKNTFIPWEMDRMNRPGAQGLRLRRTKPIAEKESTLEYCMGITV
jgi:hypothetical protein